MPSLPLLLAAVAGYLIGSIPFGYLVARARGVDITKLGSGNIGATNVGRILGRPIGLLVFCLDFAKGALPTLAAGHFARSAAVPGRESDAASIAVAAGVATFLGHLFPLYLGLRGGKGVATGFGAVAVLLPGPTALAFAVWVLTVICSRYVSLASVLAALTLIVARLGLAATPWSETERPITLFCLFASALVLLRHRGNLQRLAKGTENRLQERASMNYLVRCVHVMAVGLWFGAMVFFTFVVGLSLFATFDRLSLAEPRPLWLPLPEVLAGPPPGERFPDPLRREQGSRIAGAAVGPMFTPYYLLQAVCSVVALATALVWRPRGRVHGVRVLVLAAAVASVGVGWWLERRVEELRVERSYWSDLVLTGSGSRPDALATATRWREDFGRWHGYSLLANFVTLVLATAALALAAALPADLAPALGTVASRPEPTGPPASAGAPIS